MGIPINDILEAASLASAKTFATFYNKPVVAKSSFDAKLLKAIYSPKV